MVLRGPLCTGCGSCGQSILGVEIPGVCDGVLYYECLVCGHAWPRFLTGRLAGASGDYAARASRHREDAIVDAPASVAVEETVDP